MDNFVANLWLFNRKIPIVIHNNSHIVDTMGIMRILDDTPRKSGGVALLSMDWGYADSPGSAQPIENSSLRSGFSG
ncbi:hypothetical protein COPR103792_04695 [Corynebacterium propinquum]